MLGCGKRKIWLDPTEINEISMANSRALRSSSSGFPAGARRWRRGWAGGAGQRRLRGWRSGRRALGAPCGLRTAAFGVLTVRLVVFCAGQNVRKLVKDGLVIRKPVKIYSRSRHKARMIAKGA